MPRGRLRNSSRASLRADQEEGLMLLAGAMCRRQFLARRNRQAPSPPTCRCSSGRNGTAEDRGRFERRSISCAKSISQAIYQRATAHGRYYPFDVVPT